MDGGSVSKLYVILEISGKFKIKCELKRHLSPLTVGLITRMLPLNGNAHHMGKSIVYFETKINSGIVTLDYVTLGYLIAAKWIMEF
mgnify:CR=1 FL=1